MARGAAPGTRPTGIDNEEQAARWVRGMFGRIAPRYDLLNHLLSFEIDRYWRAQTVARVKTELQRAGAVAVDLCCGTGDLTFALEAAASSQATVFGSDFCHPMLVTARDKAARRASRAGLFEADALTLPLREGSTDLVTAAFGFRNLANYRRGLDEILRVLRPGGMAAILEFSQPPNAVLAALYGLYSRRILPAIGGAVSGSREAYSYLPASVQRFPDADEFARQMLEAGFAEVRFKRMTGGIVALHTGRK